MLFTNSVAKKTWRWLATQDDAKLVYMVKKDARLLVFDSVDKL